VRCFSDCTISGHYVIHLKRPSSQDIKQDIIIVSKDHQCSAWLAFIIALTCIPLFRSGSLWDLFEMAGFVLGSYI